MALEEKGREQTIVVHKSVFPVANYEMDVRDYVVRPAADGNTGAFTIQLPPVARAKGNLYSIVCRNADAVNAITVADNNDDSECWNGDYTLNGKCDALLCYSDGMFWHVIADIATHTGTTPAPTTLAPTTLAPTTLAQTTVAPTTVAPTTLAPTTLAPTTT